MTADRDPIHAFTVDRVGMTDLAKRATRRADEVSAEEFAHGLNRLSRLVAWLQPTVVAVLGVTGWRVAGRRDAVMGLQPEPLGGRPVVVLPNPSGLNAHARHEDLVAHFSELVARRP